MPWMGVEGVGPVVRVKRVGRGGPIAGWLREITRLRRGGVGTLTPFAWNSTISVLLSADCDPFPVTWA